VADHNGNVIVNITLDSAGVEKQSFTKMLILATPTFVPPVYVKTYASLQEALDDADLDLTSIGAVTVSFSQKLKPKSVKVGLAAFGVSEALKDSLDQIKSQDPDFFYVVSTSRNDVDIIAISEWCELNNVVYIAQTSDGDMLLSAHIEGAPTIGSQLIDSGVENTALLWYSDDADFADVAWCADRSTIDPDKKSSTWANASPVGIDADSIDTNELQNLRTYNANTLLPFFSSKTFLNGSTVQNRRIDEIIVKSWLEYRLKETIANLLLDTAARGEKLPYNEQGFGPIKAKMLNVFNTGYTVGHFEPGSAIVNLPKREELTPEQISSRFVEITFSVEPSGAIEGVLIEGRISLNV
jgi:hypothetical protein